MAQYKVPQDVEADDKLLGPFTFRQFIYLIITAGMIALAWALFQVFPLLVIIPVPIILFFGALALPLKKDQPMETYLAALVSFYLKSRKRFWEPGQPESTIRITAPKKVEVNRVKDLSQDEASHRLSFLAEIVDSEGHAIKGANLSPIKDEIVAEANSTADMYQTSNFTANNLYQIAENNMATRNEAAVKHDAAIQQMKSAIETANAFTSSGATIQKFGSAPTSPSLNTSSAVVVPTTPPPAAAPNVIADEPPEPIPEFVDQTPPAHDPGPLQQEPGDSEVFISLH